MATKSGLYLLKGQVASLFSLSASQSRTRINASIRRISTRTGSHLPRLAQPSIWQSIIPKSLRSRDKTQHATEKKPPNPASYFIWIYLFIGSQAIRIMGVQSEYNTFMRKAELKIAKLREVIEKVQRGEEVDVEKVLGTGDEVQELEWEEALREIEEEDMAWQTNKKKEAEAKAKQEAEDQEASPINEPSDKSYGVQGLADVQTPSRTSPGFY